jgi:ATP-dependent Zn protease
MGFNENPASQQSQNQGFESVNKKKQFQNQGFESGNKKRSSASAYDISDVVNNRVKQASANNGGKVDSSLFFFLSFFFMVFFFFYFSAERFLCMGYRERVYSVKGSIIQPRKSKPRLLSSEEEAFRIVVSVWKVLLLCYLHFWWLFFKRIDFYFIFFMYKVIP